MKKIVEKWNSVSLILRIVIGLAIGGVLGFTLPNLAVITLLGTLFVGALKAIAPILVFVLVISSLAGATGKIGKKFTKVITLYMTSTFTSAAVAVIASFLFPITLKLGEAASDTAPSGIGEVLTTLLNNVVTNPVTALSEANYIGILFWAVIFGLALRKSADTTKELMSDLASAISTGVKWVINLAPFGIMGLIYQAVSTNGAEIFTVYGRLVLLLVGCMLTVALITDPFIASMNLKKNAYPLALRCLKESGVTAFFTRSSAANIPVNMTLCEKLKLDKDFYSVSIPLGATINMDGAAITITIMTLATAHTLGIAVDIPTAIILSVLATISACGASGVAGGSLLLIPLACSLFGISNDIAMQVVGVGFVVGVIQDSLETAINSSGDVLFAATAEYSEWIKNGKEVDMKAIVAESNAAVEEDSKLEYQG